MMNFERLRAFQDSLWERGIPGNDLAIYLDSKPVYRYFSGYQDIEAKIPINPNTLYKMFSMTKPVTCAAALKLCEEGKFHLNDFVDWYLPEFAGTKMRIVHLFTMAAGLDYNLESPSLMDLYERTNCDFSTREFVEALAKEPLQFEPGTHWCYSLCHDVLGALIEVVSGKSFGEYLRENFFEPLGMKSATFHATPGQEMNYAIRYRKDPESGNFVRSDQSNPYQRSLRFESGGAGLSMTVDDYAKFACMLTRRGTTEYGERILSSRTVDLMRTNFLNPTQIDDLWHSADDFHRWGLGWGLGVRTVYDKTAYGTFGADTAFGWGGAWGTYLTMDPENKLTLVYAEQAENTEGAYIQRRLESFMYEACEGEGLIQ